MPQPSEYDLYNSIGQLSSHAPFQLFGPVPSLGSYLIINSKDWLNESINNINVKIKWDKSIPKSFTQHYKAYGTLPGYTNSSFKVNIYVGYQNNLHLVTPKPINLFKQKSGVIQQTSTFNIPVNNSLFKIDGQPSAYSKWDGRGFVKIELVAPVQGFGFKLYPSLLAAALLKSGFNQKDLPSQPYLPLVLKLQVSANYATPPLSQV